MRAGAEEDSFEYMVGNPATQYGKGTVEGKKAPQGCCTPCLGIDIEKNISASHRGLWQSMESACGGEM